MNKKLKVLLILAFILLIAVLSVRLVIIVFPQKATDLDTKQGIDYIKSGENNDVSVTEQKIEESSLITTQTETQTNTQTETQTQSQVQTESNAQSQTQPNAEKPKQQKRKVNNLDAAFKDTIICGDSIVKAISEYNILDSSQVIAQVGGGTKYLRDISDRIIAKNPKFIIIHIGENELDVKSRAKNFADRYKSDLEYLKQKLPNAVIVVDSIFPVEKFACKREPYLVNIDHYNSYLKKMTSEVGVIYIDYTDFWHSFTENYYDGDGIHPKYSFYTEQYLPYIYSEVISKN